MYLVESGANYNTYERLYFHGWTHVAFNCSNGSGMCFNMMAILGNSGPDQHLLVVVDGSDSDPGGAGVEFGGCYNVSQSVFRYAVGFLCTAFHSFHDNIIEYMTQPGDHAAHGNVFESSGESASNNVWYNNLVRHICLGNCSIVNLWPQPSGGYTDYFFNNVEYDAQNVNGNYFDVGQNANSGDQGTMDIFNNTFENTGNGAILTCAYGGFSEPLNATNNHYITNASSAYVSCPSTSVFKTELLQSHATAASQGYSATGGYAYSPTKSTGATIGGGTNVTSAYCAALSGSTDPLLQAAGAACSADTRYACMYSATTNSAVCPGRTTFARPASATAQSGTAWGRGAYQSGMSPAPPSNVTGTTAIQ